MTAVLGSALGLATTGPAAAAAARPHQVQIPTLHTMRPMYDVGLTSHLALPAAAGPITGSIPNFSASINDHGTTFTYRMAGKNPMVKQAAPSTTVKTIVVPLIIKLPGTGGTYDPTRGNSCDSTSALTRTMASPVFTSHPFSFGGTSVGSTQYVDAYQRANFWNYVKPGAVNPGYHVLLRKNTIPAQTVTVPSSAAAVGTAKCGKLGAVEINWLNNYLRTTLIPRLRVNGVTPTTFPLFLTQNVVEYINTAGNCCVLGFHSAYNNGGHLQTYGISMYDNTGDFAGSGDVSVLSHEVAEWMDDPFVNNRTKPWGHIGQVSGCQSNVENADPLSGTVKPVTMAGKTYHVQELAFFSWFYHQVPSIGINGWYSDYGKFRQPAAVCS